MSTAAFQLPEHLKELSNITRETPWEDVLKAFSFLKKVVNGHIIVRIDDFKYKGSIIIPDKAKRQGTKGRVVALDTDTIHDIKVGDHILYSQFAGYALKFQDVHVARCLGYQEVLSVLNEDMPSLEVEG